MHATATLNLSAFGRPNPEWGCSTWDALFLYAIARQALPPEDAQSWASWACRPVWRAEIKRDDLASGAAALLNRPFSDTPEECREIVRRLEDLYDQDRQNCPVIPSPLFSLVRHAY